MLPHEISLAQQEQILKRLDDGASDLLSQKKFFPFEIKLMFSDGLTAIKSIKSKNRIRYYFAEKNVSRETLKSIIATSLSHVGAEA